MASNDLIALLQNLQGSGAGSALNPGPLAQLPSLISSAASKQSGGASTGSTVANTALNQLGGGLTLLPIVSGLLKLFGIGGQKEAPPPLEKFALPPSIQAEAGLSSSGDTFLIDRGAGDRIRQLPAPAAQSQLTGGTSGSAKAGAGASITVNVNALDSQSFLDRREDIARAVREAMLQSHSLNDVVSEI